MLCTNRDKPSVNFGGARGRIFDLQREANNTDAPAYWCTRQASAEFQPLPGGSRGVCVCVMGRK